MTRTLRPVTRVLALDLHPQRYGYAVLETPAELLDWGVKRRYRKKQSRGERPLCKRLQSLLDLWRPSLVVVTEPPKSPPARMRQLLTDVIEEVRHCRIPVRYLSPQVLREAFSDEDRITKYAIASMLLEHFPFLASVLPPKRRIWESEDYRMSMFAAVAVALAASGWRPTTSH
jgi:hypothetical protein